MTRVGRRLLLLVVVLACLFSSCAAHAEEPRDDPRAREFFDFGARAYSKGQYLLAIDAFQEAYKLTERPGLLFSLAQTHQRQFRASGDEQHLARAIDAYRRYLDRVKAGGRRADAEHALNMLLAVAERLHPKGPDATRGPVFGRLLLSSSTPEAKLTVNGDPVETLPTALELPADKYRVSATAPGFESRFQEIAIVAGVSVPLNMDLKPLPARLQISGPTGAEVLVDGRPVGWLPLAAPSLSAGEHSVSLRKAGFRTRSVLTRLARGETSRTSLTLERTVQRNLARVAAGAALAAASATITFSVVAFIRDRSAKGIEARRDHPGGQISAADGDQLNRDVAARDQLKTFAVASGVTTGALFGTAAVLYFSDTPAPPVTMDRSRAARRPSTFAVVPLAASAWGLAAVGRF